MQAQDFEDLLTDQEIILVAEDYLLNGYFISVVPTKTIFFRFEFGSFSSRIIKFIERSDIQ